MSDAGADQGAAADRIQGQFRYGAVLILVIALVVFQIAAPEADWALAIDAALAGAALTVAVATSRARETARERRALVVAAFAVAVILLIAVGVFSRTATFLCLTLLTASIPIVLVGGLVRLIRDQGVTLQVVAGALVMYLLVGLLFASIIAFASHVGSGPYFKQGTERDAIDVYYSFTVLTTTGFGDYTARTSVGHALAVLEMLTGQLYLVTVIGVVVGNYAGRRGRDGTD